MENIEMWMGDCLSLMKYIPDKSVDMILCDLPYGETANEKDIALPLDRLWEHYLRVVKDRACIALFAQGLFYVDLVNSQRKLFRYDLIWDKVLVTGFLNARRMPMRRHEQVAIFYKKTPIYNPQFTEGKPIHHSQTDGYTNRNYGAVKLDRKTRAGSTEKYPTSILSFRKPHPSIARHRTEKSLELCEWLIRAYTNEGELVLDNTMGSGTTGEACVRTNRKFMGIELDPQYFEIARKRIEDKRTISS